MREYAYYNGIFTPYNATAIPLTDRSIFFSDAVYDVIIGREKTVYQKDEHLDRIYKNAEKIGLVGLPERYEICGAIERILDEADAENFMLYIQFSSDGIRRNHSRDEDGINVLITITECTLPSKVEKIRAITLPDLRHRLCDVKTTSLLPSVLSVEEARRRGADIAIFHRGNTVTECSYANAIIIKDGVVITHPLDSDILPGITQMNLISVCERLGIPHESRAFTVDEMHSADALMITSTTKLIKLCTEIDGVGLTVKDRTAVERLFRALKEDFLAKTGEKR